MYCVLVQPEPYGHGGEQDVCVMGPYQSREKAQAVADKIEAKYPRDDWDGMPSVSRAHVSPMLRSLRQIYGIIKERI